MSAVSYKQATQVAVASVALAVCPPLGAFGLTFAFATTIIGYYGVELLNKLNDSYASARDKRLYSVVPHRDFTAAINESDIEKSIQRFEKIGNAPEWSLDLKQRDAILKKLKIGCCYGAVSTLFHDIENNGLSIEQSALKLNREDVYFRQLIARYEIALQYHEETTKHRTEKIENTRDQERFRNFIFLLAGNLPSSMSAMIKETEKFEGYESELTTCKQQLKNFEEERAHLKEIDPLLSSILKSQTFPPDHTPQTYRYVFEKTIKSIPKDAIIRGTVNIPKHVMGIQFAPNKYYIYDTFSSNSGGLLKFSDQELFFSKLRTLVLQALPTRGKQDHKIIFQITHFHNPK